LALGARIQVVLLPVEARGWMGWIVRSFDLEVGARVEGVLDNDDDVDDGMKPDNCLSSERNHFRWWMEPMSFVAPV
jgi:hypothetical protein